MAGAVVSCTSYAVQSGSRAASAINTTTDKPTVIPLLLPQVDTMPFWSPERGPVGHRVFNDPDDERETKQISIEDTAYWFAENNGKEFGK